MGESIERLLGELATRPTNVDAFLRVEDYYVEARGWRELQRLYETHAETLHDLVHKYWQRLAEHLEGLAASETEIREKSKIFIVAGDVWSERLKQPSEAVRMYRSAFEAWHQNTEALEKARALYRRDGNWKVVLKLCEHQLKVSQTVPEKVTMLCDMAQIERDHHGDIAAARGYLAKALELDPHGERARRALLALDGKVRDRHETLRDLRGKVASVAGTARVPALVELATMLLSGESDVERTEADEMVAQALRLAPQNPDVIKLSVALARRDGDPVALGAALGALGASDAPMPERLDAMEEQARILLEEETSLDEAITVIEAGLALAPGASVWLELASTAYVASERWEDAIALFEDAIKRAGRGREATDLGADLAELYWRRLGDLDKAEPLFKRVRLADPKNERMLRFYVAYYGERGDAKRQLSMLQSLCDVLEGGQSAELLVQMAQLAEGPLKNRVKAIDLWTAVLKDDPDNEMARSSLRRLLREGEKWTRLLDLLKDEVARTSDHDPDAEISLQLEMAEIYRDHLKLPVMVANTYSAILQKDPGHPVALEALMERYRTSGRWTDLIGVLEQRLESIEPAAERADGLREIARVWTEDLGNPARAADPLERLVDLVPDDGDALKQLGAIYEATRDHAKLFGVRRREADLLDGPERVRRLREMWASAQGEGGSAEAELYVLDSLVQATGASDDAAFDRLVALAGEHGATAIIARALETRLTRRDDLDQATRIASSAQLLELRPSDDALATSLVAMYRDAGRSQDEIALLERLVAEERVDGLEHAYERLIDLYTEVEDGAYDAFRHAATRFERFPSVHAARHAGELATRAGVEDAWYPQFSEGWSGIDDATSHVTLWRMLAQIAMSIGFDTEAVLWWERVVDAEERAVDAQDALVLLLERAERWEELLERLSTWIAQDDDGARRRALEFKQVSVQALGLGRMADAIATLERMSEDAPDDPRVIAELRRLYRSEEDFASLASAARREIALESEDAIAMEAREDLIDALVGPLDQPDTALEIARDLIDLVEANAIPQSTIDVLRELAVGDVEELAQRAAELLLPVLRTLQRAREFTEVGEVRCMALLQNEATEAAYETARDVAEVYERELNDAEAAFDVLARVVGHQGGDVSLWQELVRFARSKGDLGSAIGHLSGAADRLDDTRTTLLLPTIAGLLHEVGDIDGARDTWEQLETLDPDSALGGLEALARETGDATALADILERRATRTAGEERARLLEAAADVWWQDANEPGRAMGSYRAALASDPASERAFHGVMQCAQQLGEHGAMVSAIVARLDYVEGRQGAALLVQLAEARAALGECEAAVDALGLALDGGADSEALATAAARVVAAATTAGDTRSKRSAREVQIAALRAFAGNPSALMEALAAYALECDDVDERRASYREAATLASSALQNVDRALEHARMAVASGLVEKDFVDQLITWSREMERDWDAVGALEASLEHDLSDDERHAVLVRLGRVYLDTLSAPDEAVGALERALDVQDTSTETRELLHRAYPLVERHEDALRNLQSLAESTLDGAARATLLREVATLARDKTGDAQAAIVAFEEIRTLVPGDEPALEALEALYTEHERWPELLDVLEERARVSVDPSAVAYVHGRRATVLEEQFGEIAQAIACWHDALAAQPEDGTALAQLDRLLSEEGASASLVDVLRKRLSIESDPSARGALAYRLGAAIMDGHADPEATLDAFALATSLGTDNDDLRRRLQEMLESGETSQRAAELLVEIHTKHEDWPACVAVLTAAAEVEAREEVRFDLLQRSAVISEKELGDPVGALLLVNSLLRERPSDEALLERAEALAASSGSFDLLATTYEELLLTLDNEARVVRARVRLAEIYRDHTRDLDAASAEFERVFDLDPTYEPALRALDAIYMDLEDWGRVVDTVERLIELSEDPDDKAAGWRRIATLRAEALDDLMGAIDALERAIEVGSEPVPLLYEVLELHVRAESWAHVVAVSRRLLEIEEDPAGRERLVARLARTLRVELQDHHVALRELSEGARDASGAMNAAGPVREEMIAFADDDDAPAELRSALLADLVAMHRATGAWPEFAATSEQWISLDAAPVEAFVELATVYETRLGETDAALATWTRALSHDDPSVIAGLIELMSRTKRYEDAAGAFAAAASDDDLEPTHRAELWRRSAEIYDSYVESPDAAIHAFEQVWALSTTPDVDGDGIERCLAATKRWDDLVGHYEEWLLRSENPEVRARIALRRARCLLVGLGDREGAIDALQQGNVEHPNDTNIATELTILLGHAERWDELGDLLRARADALTDPAARAEILCELADIYVHRVDEPGLAVEAWSLALDADSASERARQSLGAFVREHAAAVDPDHALVRAAERAIAVIDSARDAETRAAALEILASAAPDTVSRTAALVRLARHYDVYGEDPRRAFAAFGRALTHDPSHEDARESMRKLATRLGAWAELREALRRAADVCDDAAIAAALLVEAGDVAAAHLDDDEVALALFRAAVERDAGCTDAHQRIEASLSARGETGALIAALSMRLDEVADRETRREIRWRLVDLMQQDPSTRGEAAQICREMSDDDPTDLDALDRWEHLCTEDEDWAGVDEALSRRLGVLDDPDARRAALIALATVRRERLNNPDDAIDALRAALDIDSDDLAAQEMLIELYQAREAHHEIVTILERRATNATDPGFKAQVLLRMAEISLDALDDPHSALARTRDALASQPASDEALRVLGALAEGDAVGHEASALLIETLETSERWDDLASALAAQSERETHDAHARAATLDRLVGIFREHLDDRVAGFAAACSALETQPTVERRDRAVALVDDDSDRLQLALALDTTIPLSDDPVFRHDGRIMAARWFAEHASDIESADRLLRDALLDDPNARDASDVLTSILREAERYDELAIFLEERAVDARDPHERSERYHALAQLAEHTLGDADRARRYIVEVLDADPSDATALSELERLARLTDDPQWISDAIERQLYASETPDARAAARLKLAALRLERLGDTDGAIEAFEDVISEQPGNRDAALQLLDLYRASDRSENASRVIAALIEQAEDPQEKAAWHQQRAAIFEFEMDDPHAATAEVAAVLKLTPNDGAAADTLARLLRETERWRELADHISASAAREEDQARAQSMRLELAEIAMEKLLDDTLAEVCLDTILTFDPAHVDAMVRLGQLHSRRGDTQAAVQWLDQALALSPNHEGAVSMRKEVG